MDILLKSFIPFTTARLHVCLESKFQEMGWVWLNEDST